MKIGTRLYAAASVSIALMSILTLLLLLFSFKVSKELIRGTTADEFTKAITRLSLLTDEYILHQPARTEELLIAKLKDIQNIISDSEGIIPLEIIRNAFSSLNESFTYLRTNYSEREELLKKKAPEVEIDRTDYMEKRFATIMRSESEKILGIAFRVSSEARKKANSIQRRGFWVVSIFAILAFLTVGVFAFLIASGITKPIGEFVKGVEIIGGGDLGHRIDIKSRDEIGQLSQVFDEMVDKRKLAEEALREERDKAQKYLDIAGVMFVVINADQQVVQINKKGCEILGYGEKEIIGRNWFDTFLPRKDQTKTKKVYKQLMAGEAELAEYYENSVVTKGGEERLIAWHNTILTDDMGRAMGTLSSGEDITERRQVEEAQRDSEEKYRILVEESPVSIMAFDGEGRVTFVNNWHLKTFAKSKYGSDFFVGKKITELPGVVRAGIGPELERVLEGETVSLEDAYFPEFTGGHSGHQSIKGVPVFKGDEFVGGILLREDVSQRRRAEEELNKYRDHLEELVQDRTKDVEDAQKALLNLLEDINEAKNDLEKANIRLQELDLLKSMFIASMSHELRTPLNSIIGFTGIILQGMTGEINPEQRDQLQRVYGSAKHLLALINDVIDISKVEAGKFEVRVEKFELSEVIREAVSNLTPEITRKGLDLEVSLPQDMQITSDRKRLLQCILNYLSNAVKFTEKGGIRLAAHEVDRMIEIVVKDTGIGIKEEDVPKLFGSFIRLDSPLRTTTLGTGLGLYLTKKIATEMLGGSVRVQSEAGKGSTFYLRIPAEMHEIKENA